MRQDKEARLDSVKLASSKWITSFEDCFIAAQATLGRYVLWCGQKSSAPVVQKLWRFDQQRRELQSWCDSV